MISDNAKTFKAAAKALEKTMQYEEVQQHLSGVGVQWTFNIKRAPWWGGIFERMVRSMKRFLKKIIGKAQLSYDKLLTAVTEVEMIINSSPLTYISSEDTNTISPIDRKESALHDLTCICEIHAILTSALSSISSRTD